MQALNHDVSLCDAPVVDYFVSRGRRIPIACHGDYLDKLRGLRLLVRVSLPQKSAETQQTFVDVPQKQD